jgi:hypothetical protein
LLSNILESNCTLLWYNLDKATPEELELAATFYGYFDQTDDVKLQVLSYIFEENKQHLLELFQSKVFTASPSISSNMLKQMLCSNKFQYIYRTAGQDVVLVRNKQKQYVLHFASIE